MIIIKLTILLLEIKINEISMRLFEVSIQSVIIQTSYQKFAFSKVNI